MKPSIAPFFRHGAPVPLTADDYALRARVSLPDAKSALQRLIYAGLVSADRPHGRSLMVYEIIPAALLNKAGVVGAALYASEGGG